MRSIPRSVVVTAMERFTSEGGVVVVGQGAPSLERIAAEDLSGFLGEIVHRRVDVVDDSVGREQWPGSMVIVVGTPKTHRIVREAAAKGMISFPEPLDEQMAVTRAVIDGGKVVLFLTGRSPVGSMYAAYDFLENQCGVGFFPDGNQIPRELHLNPR